MKNRPLMKRPQDRKLKTPLRKKLKKAGTPDREAELDSLSNSPRIIVRTVELNAMHYYYHEIATIIGREFKIDPPPHLDTIRRWIKQAQEAYLNDIKIFRQQETHHNLASIDSLLRRWMPVATAENLEVMRKARQDGVVIPILDENAYDEQLKATNVCINLLAKRAELLGLNNAAALTDQTSDGDLRAFIASLAARQVAGMVIQDPKAPPVEVLELASGVEGIFEDCEVEKERAG